MIEIELEVTPEIAARLNRLKESKYSKKNKNEMFADLIRKGLAQERKNANDRT